MPAGRTFFSAKTFSSRSKAYLLRLPFGVSTTTRTVFLSSDDFNNDGSRRLETSGRLDMMSFIQSAMPHSLRRYEASLRKMSAVLYLYSAHHPFRLSHFRNII